MKYRVDLNNKKNVPVGMNSIRYYGKSKSEAEKVFNETKIGFNSWNEKKKWFWRGIVLLEWKL